MKRFCLFCLLFLLSPAVALSADLNVPSAAYPTIAAAVTADGDTIILADGTFTGAGNYDVDFGGKSLTVKSASDDPAACIIDCQ
jgi:hypothetical protein